MRSRRARVRSVSLLNRILSSRDLSPDYPMAAIETQPIARAVSPTLEPIWPSFLDLLLVIAERKMLILGMGATGALLAALAALLLPVQFTATAVIMPPQQQQSAASALLGQLG